MEPPSYSGGEESSSSGDGDAAVLLGVVAKITAAAATVVAMRTTLLVTRAQRQRSRHGSSRIDSCALADMLVTVANSDHRGFDVTACEPLPLPPNSPGGRR
jgi:hypothetical protein